MKDYYEILQVAENASEDDIKKSFRNLSKKYHPDINKDPSAEKVMKEITQAYETLSNPDKRRQYDMSKRGMGSGIPFGFDPFGGVDPFDNFFNFGGMFRQAYNNVQQKPPNLVAEVTLSFLESFTGTKKEIPVSIRHSCSVCSGSGDKSGKKPQCSRCHGVGRIKRVMQQMGFSISTHDICPVCNGSGVENSSKCPCDSCAGNGYTLNNEVIVIDIPAGSKHGEKHLLRERGHYGQVRGDLVLCISVEEDDKYKRIENDLYLKEIVSLHDILGKPELEISHLTGEKLKIKVDSLNNITRFKRKGFRKFQEHGDFIVELDVKLPHLSKDKVEKIKEILS